MNGVTGPVADFFNGIVEFATTAGVPQDIARTVLMLLIGSQFFSLTRKTISRGKGVGLGIVGALLLMNYGPFRAVIEYAINVIRKLLAIANINI